MKQLILAGVLAATTFTAQADTPGKPTNHANKVTLQNVASLNEYTLYWKKHYGDTTIIVSSDTSLVIPGSGGAPDGADFWGIHKKNGRSTDTLLFSNHYAPDFVVILNGLKGDSIRHSQLELSNENEVVKGTNTDSIANKQLVLDATKMEQKHTLNNVLLGAAVGVALGALTWFFINRRKKKQQKQSGTVGTV